jgi:hypothetical protein
MHDNSGKATAGTNNLPANRIAINDSGDFKDSDIFLSLKVETFLGGTLSVSFSGSRKIMPGSRQQAQKNISRTIRDLQKISGHTAF